MDDEVLFNTIDHTSEILERMEKLQSRQDLANKLQTVIRWAEQALEGIRRQEQEEVRGIWNP